MEEKMPWLRSYTLALAVGVVLIVLTGILVTSGPVSSDGMTGYVVFDDGAVPTGTERTFSIISKDCALTPAVFVAKPGDRIRLEATTYDPSGLTHRIAVRGMDVEISVRGKEVNYAEFVAEEGTFVIADEYPCEAKGVKARTKLIVK
jgi:hypothetical protein